MAYEFKFPDIGEGLVEGELTTWLVKEGDYVKEDQPLCEVMTDKANVEIPSPVNGRIVKMLAKEGEIVPVHQVILHIDRDAAPGAAAPKSGSNGSAAASKPASAATPAPASSAGSTDASQFDDIPLFSPTAPPKKRGATPAPEPVAAAAPSAPVSRHGLPARPLAAPATRKLARELGVDLKTVAGSGPAGRISPTDVRRAAQQPSAAPVRAAAVSAPTAPAGGERREPLKGLRRKIAENMVKSKQTAPHYSFFEEVDLTQLVQLRKEMKPLAESKGVHLTYMPFYVKAVVHALKQFPLVNSMLDDATQEIVYKNYYHVGIATATEQGLLVPVVKNCDQLSIWEIASEIKRIADAARNNRANLDDLKGSTFTLTNVGTIGGLMSTPIINHPEVGIMGIHAIKQKPWVVNGQIGIRDISVLSCSFDHRVVDGAVGAQFLIEVIRMLENPGMLGFVD